MTGPDNEGENPSTGTVIYKVVHRKGSLLLVPGFGAAKRALKA